MKVVMLNGSPNKHGCTYTALKAISEELSVQGIESEIVWLGNGLVRGCIGCGGCKTAGKCGFFNRTHYTQPFFVLQNFFGFGTVHHIPVS